MCSSPSVYARHPGIDMLRIVSMLMVCILHVNLWGSWGAVPFQHQPWSYLSWVGAESACLVAVNCYAMITGYVCITQEWRLVRYIRIAIHVAFYLLVIPVLYACCLGPLPKIGNTLGTLFSYAFPSGYWYVHAYTFLFVLIPFLNRFLAGLTVRQYGLLMLVLILLFPLLNIVLGRVGYQDGYKAVWLVALYCAGGWVRLHAPTASKPLLLGVYGCCIAGTFGMYVLCRHGMSYVSPPVVIASLALFWFFTSVRRVPTAVQPVIRLLAPLTFGVYLVQMHPAFWHLAGRLTQRYIAANGWVILLPWVGGILLFGACAAVDYVRLRLFRAASVARAEEALATLLTEQGERMLSRFLPSCRS